MDAREQAEQLLVDIRTLYRRADEEGIAFVHEFVELVETSLRAREAAVWEEAAKLCDSDQWATARGLAAVCREKARAAREGGGA